MSCCAHRKKEEAAKQKEVDDGDDEADEAMDSNSAQERLVARQEAKLLDFCCPKNLNSLPPKPTFAVHVEHAKKLRDHMRKACTQALCAVCSMSKPESEVSMLPAASIPNLSLLQASPDTLTKAAIHGNEYILQPVGVDGDEVGVCCSCLQSLERDKVPVESLASFDAGPIPAGLVPLTMVEENLVARYQVTRWVGLHILWPNNVGSFQVVVLPSPFFTQALATLTHTHFSPLPALSV